MLDYRKSQNVKNRLMEEFIKYGKLIIAVDFDGTIHDFHNQGLSINDTIDLLRKCKEQGHTIIIFTCREEKDYDYIEKYMKEKNIPYDGINCNAKGLEFFNGKNRKIYYNILLDDRAGLESAYRDLKETINIIDKCSKDINEKENYLC